MRSSEGLQGDLVALVSHLGTAPAWKPCALSLELYILGEDMRCSLRSQVQRQRMLSPEARVHNVDASFSQCNSP